MRERAINHLAWMLGIPLAALAIALPGCGGGGNVHTPTSSSTTTSTTATSTSTTTSTPTIPAGAQRAHPCPVDKHGQHHIGSCILKTPSLLQLSRLRVNGRYIPDIYEGEGCANWQAARGSIAGGIVKAFEFRADSAFACNWARLRASGLWHAAYLFAHSCSQADAFVATVNAAGGFDSGPPIIDEETPDAAGTIPCLTHRIEQLTGWRVVEVYTAPGTNPGGGIASLAENPLWIATYGSGFAPGCQLLWTCSPNLFQFTDGTVGPGPHCTAIGCGDVSVNLGITSIVRHPPRTWLREGDRGRSVWLLVHRLVVAGWIGHHGDFYSHNLALIVKSFQHHHHLKPATGITGSRSWLAAKSAAEYAKHHPHARRPI